MKLDYNILWIDNDLKDYIDNGSIKDVEEILTEKGFEPNIELVFDEANLDEFIDKHDYDLIISDYNLENTTGDVIIERIRVEKQLDTEILFYTAQTENSFKNKEEVRNRLAFIERLTFQIGRDRLMDKIEKVINLTLKKLLELNATRGLITAATSHLDVEIEDLVMILVYEKLKLSDADISRIINHYVDDFLKKSPEHFLKKYNEVGFKNWFHRIEANRKWKIFRTLLKKIDDDAVRSFLESNKDYGKEVIDIRNKFAHAKAESNQQGILVLKGQFGQESFEFTEESCIKIRQDLINHKRNIETLKQSINK